MKRCHVALRGTRGAAISIAFISTSEGGMTWLGVGNVEGRVPERRPVGDTAEGLARPRKRRCEGCELPAVRTAHAGGAAGRRSHPRDRRRRLARSRIR